MVSAAWKQLSDEERSVYEAMSNKDKARYEVEKKMYNGTWTVPIGFKRTKDATAPRRPESAFLAFSNKKRAKLKKEMPGATNGDISKMLSKMWQSAPASVKERYQEIERAKRDEYKIAVVQWREETDARLQERQDEAMRLAESGAKPPSSCSSTDIGCEASKSNLTEENEEGDSGWDRSDPAINSCKLPDRNSCKIGTLKQKKQRHKAPEDYRSELSDVRKDPQIVAPGFGRVQSSSESAEFKADAVHSNTQQAAINPGVLNARGAWDLSQRARHADYISQQLNEVLLEEQLQAYRNRRLRMLVESEMILGRNSNLDVDPFVQLAATEFIGAGIGNAAVSSGLMSAGVSSAPAGFFGSARETLLPYASAALTAAGPVRSMTPLSEHLLLRLRNEGASNYPGSGADSNSAYPLSHINGNTNGYGGPSTRPPSWNQH